MNLVNKKSIKKIIFLFLTINFCFFVFSANAANLGDAFRGNLYDVSNKAGYNPDTKLPENIISTVINTVLSFLGVIFLILIMYAGFLWMTARGNEQRLEKAKDTLTAAIIGLLIIASAYAISFFVMSKISTQTLKTSTSTAVPTTK
jgi:hypothetical protein